VTDTEYLAWAEAFAAFGPAGDALRAAR